MIVHYSNLDIVVKWIWPDNDHDFIVYTDHMKLMMIEYKTLIRFLLVIRSYAKTYYLPHYIRTLPSYWVWWSYYQILVIMVRSKPLPQIIRWPDHGQVLKGNNTYQMNGQRSYLRILGDQTMARFLLVIPVISAFMDMAYRWRIKQSSVLE